MGITVSHTGQVNDWRRRMNALFADGQIFMDPGAGQGKTPFHIIWEQAECAKPIFYNNKVLHLFSRPSKETLRSVAASIQQVVQLAIERVDVEFDINRPEVTFTAFDLGRWAHAVEENHQGRPDSRELLLGHAKKLFRHWQLSGSQGVQELEAWALVLLADERER